MKPSNSADHIPEMQCPMRGKRLGDVDTEILQRWFDRVKEKAERAKRVYEQHVKETVDAVEAELRARRNAGLL